MTIKDWFDRAEKSGFALGAFNIDNFEIFKAVCVAARNKNSPVIVEFSQGEVFYFGLRNVVDMVKNAREEYKIPIILNLDHASKVEQCLEAVDHGFDMVHFDGSNLLFEENLKATQKVVKAAHAKNILVEGEIDKISGTSEVHNEEINPEILKHSYTDSVKALNFVEKSEIDILAPVIGNVHGIFEVQPELDLGLLEKIRSSLPDTFLSLHGGSGIPARQVKEAIKIGKIIKVNVNTELRQAFRDALGEELGEQPNQYKYYELTGDIIEAISAVVEAKIEVFGSFNKA